MQENGYSEKVAKFISQGSRSLPEYKINSELNSSTTLSKDVKAKLSEKYNLVEPEEKPVKTIVLVKTKGDSNNTLLKANAIGNVWLLQYPVTDTNFSINVLNVGSDHLDSIYGYVQKYNLKSYNWALDTSKNVSRTQVGTGNVFSWTTAKNFVEEKFEYDITVTEDGVTWSYDNIGDNDITRYNFSVGAYSSITANGGERHHLVSSSALSKAGFNTNTAAVIRMITRDHANTSSWGSGTEQSNFRIKELTLIQSGNYQQLLQLEVDGLKRSVDSEGIYPNLQQKYYDEVLVALFIMEEYFGIN